MPRQPRLDLPGHPVHVTQRGVNHCAIFIDEEDRHRYRHLLQEACAAHSVAIHAFVLMSNHVHLLLTPAHAGCLARAMRSVGQNHVQAFNARHGRSGSLWQGRYKSSVVATDMHLLRVIRYIELNPVRAALVALAEDYRWSSVHSHLARACDQLLTLHPVYLALGGQPDQRAKAYGDWLRQGVGKDELATIRRHLAQERALGDERFQRMVGETLNRPAECRPRGRPKRLPTVSGE